MKDGSTRTQSLESGPSRMWAYSRPLTSCVLLTVASTGAIVPNHFCTVTTDPLALNVTPLNWAGPTKPMLMGGE